MELNAVFIRVIGWYDRYATDDQIYYKIFEEMQAEKNHETIDSATCILTMIDDRICYRKSYTVDGNRIYNKFGLMKNLTEVIPYDGDPVKLKETIKLFVQRLKAGSYHADNEIGAKALADDKEVLNKATGRNKMNKVLDKMIEVNKESAVNTAKIELGKSANQLVLNKVKNQLPAYVKGYADSPLAELVVGNVVAGLLLQFAGDNKKAQILSDAMIAAGVHVAVESLDIPGLVKELLENVTIPDDED